MLLIRIINKSDLSFFTVLKSAWILFRFGCPGEHSEKQNYNKKLTILTTRCSVILLTLSTHLVTIDG